MRIIIVGGGKTGTYLADRLHHEHDVTLIDQRAEAVENLRRRIPEVEILLGDACEPEMLESARTGEADLVIAVTGDDEDNLVIAMLTKVLGDAVVYARVNHPRNEWLFDKEWGVDVAVSSPEMTYGLISRDLAFGDVIPLLELRKDDVEVDEVRLPAGASAVGRTLGEVALPGNVTVMAILSPGGGGVRPARGDALLGAGDQLLLLAQGEIDEPAVLEALGITKALEVAEQSDEHHE